MIAWVDQRLERWGLWKRGDLNTGYGESPIARMIRGNIQQSSGDTPRGLGLQIDDVEAMETDALVATLPDPLPRLLSCWYGSEAPAQVIAARFRVCRRTIYIWRDRAHDALADKIDAVERKKH